MSAPRSVLTLTSENLVWAKVSHQLSTEPRIWIGNSLYEAEGKGVLGCSASEGIERRNIPRLGGRYCSFSSRQKVKAMNLWLKSIRNLVKLQEWWEILGQKLTGHYNYYGISGNFAGISEFYKRTIFLTHKWINRRSQKKSYNWEQFNRFLKYNPLPKPKIYHITYTLSSLRGCIPVEPNDRIGHVRFCERH